MTMTPTSPLRCRVAHRIPQEIFDNILANLEQSSVILKRCSLVCRAWLSTCRLHLFAEVYLTPSFTQFIHDDDHLAPYVRHAIICDSWDKSPVETRYRLLGLVPKLKRLKCLSFEYCPLNLIELFASSNASITNISEVHLTQIHFHSFPKFQETVLAFSGLKTLGVDGTTWGAGDGADVTDVETSCCRRPAKLLDLELHYCPGAGSILDWLSTSGNLHVRSLIAPDLNPSEVDSLGRFIRAHGPSLNHLTIGFFPQSNPDPNFLDQPTSLSSCTRLTRLRIDQIILYQFPSVPQLLHPARDSLADRQPHLPMSTWYIKLLSSVTSSLSHLSLALWFSAESQLNHMDWSSLNTLFLSSPSFATLEEVEFLVLGYGPSSDLPRDWIRDRLPGLRSTTSLRVVLH